VPRIDELYCFVTSDDDGEGVAAFYDRGSGTWMPLIAADEARVDSLRAKARELVEASGKTIRLLRFSVREELEVIAPAGRN
jgi:predicted lipoprotein with Yx(FWY)xxD motif